MNINTARIEVILAERRITKAELAENCGMARQNLSNLLRRGTCEPRTAGKLAAGLGVSVAEITEEARR